MDTQHRPYQLHSEQALQLYLYADGALTGTAQARMIEFTGSLTAGRNRNYSSYDVENFYILKNTTSGAQTVQFKYASGSGDTFTFAAAQ